MYINAVANSVVLQLYWVYASVKNKWKNSIAYRGDSIVLRPTGIIYSKYCII